MYTRLVLFTICIYMLRSKQHVYLPNFDQLFKVVDFGPQYVCELAQSILDC